MDIWMRLCAFLGKLMAVTIVVCAWAVIITFTLKVLWFTVFRILV